MTSYEDKLCYADDDVDDNLDNMAKQRLRRVSVVDHDKRFHTLWPRPRHRKIGRHLYRKS